MRLDYKIQDKSMKEMKRVSSLVKYLQSGILNPHHIKNGVLFVVG